ncbi:urate hydroxylase PuuD [Polynucleobacter sp. AP-Jannik-300A-C4]|uniref:urate hydroxylase PuuD n=1 Tax=Polynucleobacter sp. AP-Jannik-300A-C4 TaxID=2576928 RepID=UPI001BFE2ECC|nr:urate hydroxylase PuuD [Polynucleobacter sp. AP-Jannik-300A-C4]QWE21886.1 urate hydroxylase PuuD [Polynucleobacter sp. AP-Jannik-300A-C4]
MASIFTSLGRTVLAGFVLLALIVLGLGANLSSIELPFLFRWIHVMVGVMWVGLLWYFNFVQIPSMPKIPDEQKPAIGKVIAPTALFWFRWAALFTVISGMILAVLNGYAHQAFTLQAPFRAIGLGMWIALVMAFNVWFIIWPLQKRALGIVAVESDVKAKSARVAMLVSRFNTMLSIPMLFLMVAQSHNATWFVALA